MPTLCICRQRQCVVIWHAMIEQTPQNKCTSMYDTDSARNRLIVYSLLFQDSEPPDNKRVETSYINRLKY